jgi:hypothetical protein
MTDNLKAVGLYLLARGSEASTWAGLSALLVGAGWNVPSGVMQTIVQSLTIACGVAAIILKGR